MQDKVIIIHPKCPRWHFLLLSFICGKGKTQSQHTAGVSFWRNKYVREIADGGTNDTDLADKGEHMTRNIALRKTSASICKEVLPLAFERGILVYVSKRWIVF